MSVRRGDLAVSLPILLVCALVCFAGSVGDRKEELAVKKAMAEKLLSKQENAKAVALYEQLLAEVPVAGGPALFKNMRVGCDRLRQGWRFEKALRGFIGRIVLSSLPPAEERSIRKGSYESLATYYHDHRHIFAEIDAYDNILMLSSREEVPAVEVKLANAYEEAGFYEKALGVWKQKLEADGKNFSARRRIAGLHFRLGEVDRGIATLGQDAEPSHLRVAAKQLYDARILDAAEELAERAAKDDEGAKPILASIYYEQKRFSEAAAIFDELCRKEEDVWRLFKLVTDLALTYANLGVLQERIEEVEAETSSVRTLVMLAVMKKELGDHEGALKALMEYLNVAPEKDRRKHVLAKYGREAIKEAMTRGGPEEAEVLIEELQKEKGLAGIGVDAARYMILLSKDEKEKADELLDGLLSGIGDAEDKLHTLASALEDLGAGDACADIYRRILEMSPHDSVYDANGHAYLGKYYYNKKEYDKAKDHLDKLDASLIARNYGIVGEEPMRMMEAFARYKASGDDPEELLRLLHDPRLSRRLAAAGLLARYGSTGQIESIEKEIETAPVRLRVALEEAVTGIRARSLPGSFHPGRILEEDLADRLAECGFLLWIEKDEFKDDLRWAAMEREFIARVDMKSGEVFHYRDMMEILGLGAATASCIAFTEKSVWVGTDRGLFAYDRGAHSWTQYAVGGESPEIDVQGLEMDKEVLLVTAGAADDAVEYAFDTKRGRWLEEKKRGR